MDQATRNTIARRRWAKVKLPLATIKLVAAQPERFELRDSEQCLFTYAKAYYRGGGWWLIAGYSENGSDVLRVLDALNERGSLQ